MLCLHKEYFCESHISEERQRIQWEIGIPSEPASHSMPHKHPHSRMLSITGNEDSRAKVSNHLSDSEVVDNTNYSCRIMMRRRDMLTSLCVI